MALQSSSDAELGSIKTSWTNSYNGQKCFFVDQHHLMYKCGSIVKVLNTENGKTSDFVPPYFTNDPANEAHYGNGVSLLTANSAINKFAYSETRYPPVIHVHNFDAEYTEQSVLLDGATLEYIAIEFSNSSAILGLAGIPDLTVTVWLWEAGNKVASIDISAAFTSLQSVQFSPVNWRHVAVATHDDLSVWKIEQCGGKLTKTSRTRMIMAPIDPDYAETTLALRDEFKYPKHVISALEDEYADAVEEALDKRERHKLRCVCWTNNNELLAATDENYIFLYSVADRTMKCVYQPGDGSQPFEFTERKAIRSMLVHRYGLFIAGNDGKVRFGVLMKDQTVRLDVQIFDQIAIVKLLDMSASFIANLSANTTYSSLSIGTNRGIYMLNCQAVFKSEDKFAQETISAASTKSDSRLYPALSFDHGVTVGIGSLHPYSDHFVVLKDHGCLQVWSHKKGAIVNRVHLDVQCTCLATHNFVQMVAVGTASGRLIFVDLSEVDKPRIILNSKLHTKAVKLLKFNSSDTMLISVGEDNKLFVIDSRLMGESVEATLLSRDQRLRTNYNQSTTPDVKFEKGFYVRGYMEFEGEPICLDVFDSISDEVINTRVALGIFDKTTWDTIKKSVYDDALAAQELKSSQSNSANAGSINASMNHNLLVQSVQTKPTISRYMCVHNVEYVNFDVNSTAKTANLACKIIVLDLNLKMFAEKEKLYHTKKLDFKDEAISKSVFFTQYLFSDLALSSRNYLVTFADRFLIKLAVPDYDPNKKPSAKLNYLELADIVGSHDFGYGGLSRSLNNQFIVSCGFDGTVIVRKAIDLKSYIETKANHYKTGGLQAVRFQFDPANILALAQENTVIALHWNCQNPEIKRLMSLAKMEGEFDRAQLPKLKTQMEIGDVKTLADELSWYEMKEKQFFKEQDEQYMPVIKEITTNLKDIKEKLNQLMKVNAQREDLAKLKESEFYLDLEELDRLNKESDAEIQKIREKDELDNLSKIYMREVIKRECWDQMKVKGQGIQAFNNNLLVENYALRERTREELAALERCKFIRRIEIAAAKSRPDFVIEPGKRDGLILSLVETDEDDSKDKDPDTGANAAAAAANQNFMAPNLLHLASKGSIGSLFNGDSNLFYNQFELYTREQKWIQVTLIQDAIHRIKENFNREFEQISQRKLQEIGKIREKNQRLKQIYVDLNEERALSEPELGDQENAELLFEVKDSEIKVEKYLTPEQRKALEEQMAEEARRRELEKLDNWRERGLMDMMGGVLQIRREDELKKDIPVPPFVKEKAQEEWTPEEVKQFQIYEQKVKDLNEEREKLRKQLLAEINKLNEQIVECYSNFDSVLLGLHQRKVKTQQAIFQEELKIVRILNSLIVDSELSTYESQMLRKLEKCKLQRRDMVQETQQIKKEIELIKEDYEKTAASAEEKPLDKQFSREFSDVSSGLRDQLLKLLKRRNKPRFVINKTNLPNPTQTYLPELGELNPFSERPSTAQQILISEADIETSLNELDNFSNAPTGIDQTIWDRFVQFRRQKIALETSVRMKGLMLSEMQAYLQSRYEEENVKRQEIEELTENAIKLQQLRLQAFHNLEVQYLIKQGQVEINPGPSVHNFENCLLIRRNVVETLNKTIQSHGKQKITIMVNCKNLKKGIRQLDWERKKMSMTIEDYIQKQRDITYLKLSREVQEYLNSEDYEGKKQKEISVLEQTLTYQVKQHEKVYAQKNKRLKEIEYKAVKVANSNDQLDDKLLDSNVVLHDRKHLKEEQTGQTIKTIRDERFRDIVQRRRLVDLAKAQAQEVAFLRSEVERLRMKTFPALVQIEF